MSAAAKYELKNPVTRRAADLNIRVPIGRKWSPTRI